AARLATAARFSSRPLRPTRFPSLWRRSTAAMPAPPIPRKHRRKRPFSQMFVKMMGNVQRFILFIAVFVTVSLTLVAANGMAMSMRERTTEIAVLKAIGFQNGKVLALLLGEAVLIAATGGLLGV